MRMKAALGALLTVALLTACGELPVRDSGPNSSMDTSKIPDPVAKWEPRSQYGNKPYQVSGINYQVMDDATGYVERGLASWYGLKFHGQYTSSREIYDMYGMTAAHRTLPLPTYVRVTNIANGRSCVVRINDRGPFHSDRLIDLSYAAASKIGIVESGTAMVEVRVIDAAEDSDEPRISQPVVTAQPEFRGGTASVLQPIPVALPAPAPIQAAASTPAPLPAIETQPAAAMQRYLQVGAFSVRDNAERLRLRLHAEEKLPAILYESIAPNRRPLYLVKVGPIGSDAEAERIATRIEGLGLGKPRLIRDQP